MAIYLIILISVLTHTAFNGSRVVVSLLAIAYGANPFTVGVLASLYALCPLFLAIHTGRLIDHIGARVPMIAGTLGVTVGLLLPGLFPGLATLYCTALLLGSSFMLFFVALNGITGAVGKAEDRTRNYVLLSVGFSISGFCGPLVAGFSIDYLGHLNAFLVLCAATVVALLVLWLGPALIPRLPFGEESQDGQSVKDLLRIPALRHVFVVGGILSGAWDLYLFFMPVYGHHVGLSASEIGMVMSAFAVATFAIRLVLSRVAAGSDGLRVLNLSIFVASAVYFIFPFLRDPWALAGISLVLGLGLGVGQPLSMNLVYNLAPGGRTSEAAGVRVSVNNMMHVGIPLLYGGIGLTLGFTPVFVLNAILLLSSGLIGIRATRRAPERR